MSSTHTVLVFEYFAGGGCPSGELPGGLAGEALAMLWALLQDFRRWGAVRTITALDPRFEGIVPGLNRATLPADKVIAAASGQHDEIYLSLLDECDSVIIIAPETDGILAEITAMAENSGVPVLGSNASAVEIAGNKAACSRVFDLSGLPAPLTRTATLASAHHTAELLGFPLVVKPIDGVGSEGVFLVDRAGDLPPALERIRNTTAQEQILLQSVAEGVPASASLLMAGDRCLPVSLNLQLIEPGTAFQYLGSRVPLRHPVSDHALNMACEAVKLIPGLKGYVGVDMVLAEKDVRLIEINPRLTTSYIALRQTVSVNLAEAIWDACINEALPTEIILNREIEIRKDNPATWGLFPAEWSR
jgi:hypothetical protein